MLDGHVQELALVQVAQLPGEDFERVVRSLLLTPSFGPIWYTGLDLGTPAPDVDSTRISNDNGEDDRTRFFGARAVAINLTVSDEWFPTTGADLWDPTQNSSAYWVKELGRWSAPGFRSWLYVRFTGDPVPYRIDLSGRGQVAVVTSDGVNREIRTVQMNFACPSGILREFSEDTDTDRATRDGRLRYVFGFFDSGGDGIGFPMTFPISFPADFIGNGAPINYPGTVANGAIFRIYAQGGDVENPSIRVVTNGISAGDDGGIIPGSGDTRILGFQGLTIPDGQYAEINCETKTLWLNGDPASPIDNWLVGPLRWLRLEPGLNYLQLTQNLNADGSSPAAAPALSYAECLYYPASL
jgi:hypothetical protein